MNNSPIFYNSKLPELADAGIPFVRTHDTGGAFGGAHLVDTTNVFPNFSADPSDPDSYDKVSRTYYSFWIYNALYKLGRCVHSECGEAKDGIYVCAAKDEKGAKAMMVVNRNGLTTEIAMTLKDCNIRNAELLLLDSDHLLTPVNWLLDRETASLRMPPFSIALIRELE
ncbi:MAG: hypothetical protein IJJ33_12340 [Victivallales bacterium]|nr:hypothetical protein [Victivallales bacterium]